MVRSVLLSMCLPAMLAAGAQTAPATYWVRFTDKATTPFSIGAPQDFLSPRAIHRRESQGIPIDDLDLPVDPAYISALLAAGQFQLHTVSKWFNAVTIRSTDTLALDTITSLPFVSELRCLRPGAAEEGRTGDKFGTVKRAQENATLDETYGASLRGISMMNGHLLHELGGARGEGMLIGILDAGFDRANSMDAFSALRDRNGILLTGDIVCPGCDVYQQYWHGRSVLSVLAGQLPGKLMGTAPNADYILLRTEDTDSEYPVEEDNWIRGAEIADSIGCDVLNTSLGYTDFDDSTMDHVRADLDGLTVRISIAAGIASRKGMIPVQSAGNSGTSEWHYISAPADAIDILTVGAVDEDRAVTNFSSRGPSVDGRVKPDVCAVGLGTVGVSGTGDDVERINGTSFASPLVCGLTACLWQLHPDQTAHAIMDAVRRSASHFHQPNDSIGYGIPDFWRAHLLLGGTDLTGLNAPAFFNVYPLPFSNALNIELFTGETDELTLDLFDVTGRAVLSRILAVEPRIYQQLRLEDAAFTALPNGHYTLRASLGGHAELTRPLVKAP
jgi:serine protease AprX